MLTAVEQISDSIEKYRANNGCIQEAAMGVGLNGRMVRLINNGLYFLKLPILFKSTTAACNGNVALMNIKLFEKNDQEEYGDRARKSLDWILSTQTQQGYWYYNIPGWKNKISVVDGDTAALALLKGYKVLNNRDYLDAALKWCNNILTNKSYTITPKGGLSFNYFINGGKTAFTPNATTITLRALGGAYQVTQEEKYLKLVPKAIEFLNNSQLPSGELRYNIYKEHYSCPQYNAFEFIDLYDYYKATNDDGVTKLMKDLIEYLIPKVNDDGSVPFGCFHEQPLIYYHSAVVGAALASGYELNGKRICLKNADKCINFVLSHQNKDGTISYGRKALLKIFNDNVLYPRPTAYIGYHLLIIWEQLKKENFLS